MDKGRKFLHPWIIYLQLNVTVEIMFHVMVQIANIIFVDAPVGTGFSYSTTWEGYQVSDTLSAAETYEFLRKVRESVFLNRKI